MKNIKKVSLTQTSFQGVLFDLLVTSNKLLEIHSAFSELSDQSKSLDWSSFVEVMQITIVQSYKRDHNLKDFKNNWKNIFKRLLREFGYTSKRSSSAFDSWNKFIKPNLVEVKEPMQTTVYSSSKSSSTSALKYQKRLGPNDAQHLHDIHQRIENKWVLKSGRSVEDIMYDMSKSFSYEQ